MWFRIETSKIFSAAWKYSISLNPSHLSQQRSDVLDHKHRVDSVTSRGLHLMDLVLRADMGTLVHGPVLWTAAAGNKHMQVMEERKL